MEALSLSVTPSTITDYLLLTLRADEDLADIKKWFLGEPAPSQYPSSPWGWVEWTGGRQTPSTVSNKMGVEDTFFVVVVSKHPSSKQAETNVMSYVETVETSFASDRTLDGNVAYSHVSNREKQKQFMGDHSIVAARITIHTIRKKQS